MPEYLEETHEIVNFKEALSRLQKHGQVDVNGSGVKLQSWSLKHLLLLLLGFSWVGGGALT